MSSLRDFIASGAGLILKSQLITSGISQNWVIPTKLQFSTVWLTAIGGGGGGAYSTTQGFMGGASGFSLQNHPYDLTIAQSFGAGAAVNYTVGIGGAGRTGSQGDGGSGQDTVFGNKTLPGGRAGNRFIPTQTIAGGALGGYVFISSLSSTTDAGAVFPAQSHSGPYGGRGGMTMFTESATQATAGGGGGLVLDDTVLSQETDSGVGFGAGAATRFGQNALPGKNGAIFLQWFEKA